MHNEWKGTVTLCQEMIIHVMVIYCFWITKLCFIFAFNWFLVKILRGILCKRFELPFYKQPPICPPLWITPWFLQESHDLLLPWFSKTLNPISKGGSQNEGNILIHKTLFYWLFWSNRVISPKQKSKIKRGMQFYRSKHTKINIIKISGFLDNSRYLFTFWKW